MTADAAALEEELTRALGALDGVRSVFPTRTAAATILAIAHRSPDGPARLVRVDDDGSSIRVSVRLGTARTVPTALVVAAATAAVAEVVAARPFTLELEFAAID